MEFLTFNDYCKDKSIDPALFKRTEPELYTTFEREYSLIHPDSFTAQKLFLINDIRRRFQYKKPVTDKKETTPNAKPALKTIKISNSAQKIKIGTKKDKIEPSKEINESKAVKPAHAIKPVIKPKTQATSSAENTEVKKAGNLKPKIGKPVIKKASALKPQIKTDAKKGQEDTKKKVVPSLKTKIPPTKPE